MLSAPTLPIPDILDHHAHDHLPEIGRSREGRAVAGIALGTGSLKVSLIAGCHADEPVGPDTLGRLASFLETLGSSHPLLTDIAWWIVPHANPDGRRRNASWSAVKRRIPDHRGADDRGYDPAVYLRHVVRELPGDDIEFGFPRDGDDRAARPENRAIADFLTAAGPFHLHGSLHGMAFSPGPWFLIEEAWIESTGEMRNAIRQQVAAMGYSLFDPDRGGEKGFSRIDAGFCTRPDSRAMAAHFIGLDDHETASRFRPSSMELVRSLGGDPLTFVSEMPLFLTPAEIGGAPVGVAELQAIRLRLEEHLDQADEGGVLERTQPGLRAMPIRDQQRLQLIFLQECLRCVARCS